MEKPVLYKKRAQVPDQANGGDNEQETKPIVLNVDPSCFIFRCKERYKTVNGRNDPVYSIGSDSHRGHDQQTLQKVLKQFSCFETILFYRCIIHEAKVILQFIL